MVPGEEWWSSQERAKRSVYHPRRLRHEPTAVIFNTFGSYKDTVGTLPAGTRPVGEWMGTTRIGLAMARTPKLWLVVIDEVDSKAPQQGRLPLTAGESFWLVWSQDGIWARKPRFPDDIAQLGGASIFPPTSPPRPPTPPERRGGYMPDRTQTDQQRQPRGRPDQAMPEPLPESRPEQAATPPAQVAGSSQGGRGQGRQTSPPDTSGQPRRPNVPSPGSESETSWPSEDNEDYDNSGLMQTGGRASSSTDPMPTSDDANSHNLLDNLDNILQTLLQQSFLQPREEVTDLAYRACSKLLALRRSLTGDPSPPAPLETVPDDDRPMLVNPLAEAQIILRQLVLQHNEMTTGQLRSILRQVQDILSRARRVIDSQGEPPHPKARGPSPGTASTTTTPTTTTRSTRSTSSPPASCCTCTSRSPCSTRTSTISAIPTWRSNVKHWGRYPISGAQGTTDPGATLALEQEAAATLSEAHSLLFSWTSALWGGAILLVDDVETATAQLPSDLRQELAEPEGVAHVGEQEGETSPGSADTALPTQNFSAASPTEVPGNERQRLARQESHRRRRLHAAFLDTPDSNGSHSE